MANNVLEKNKNKYTWAARTLVDLRNPTFASFLDLARWICAWIVFLSHLRNPLFLGFESLDAANRTFLVRAWYFVTGWHFEAVIGFFVLSGYLVGAVACARASLGQFVAVDYAVDRACRIFLPFLPALALTVVFDLAGAHFFGDLGFYNNSHPMIHEKMLGSDFGSQLTLKNFILNLSMLQTIIAPPLGSNEPLWSISIECWFYVVFGFGLISWIAAAPVRRWGGLFASALLAAAFGQYFLVLMGFWLIGAGIAFVSAPALERPRSALLLLLFVLVLNRFAKNAIGHGNLVMVGNYCVACSFAWLLLSMRRARSPWLKRLRGFNALLSSFSYSLYLIHFPLMLLMLGALYATGRFDGIARGYSPTDVRGLLAYATVTSAVGLFAFAFAQITERQTPKLRRFLKRRITDQFEPATLHNG